MFFAIVSSVCHRLAAIVKETGLSPLTLRAPHATVQLKARRSMAQALQLPVPQSFVDLRKAYQQLLLNGWRADAAQAMAVSRLQSLANALMTDLQHPPKGLWLYGPPGRGKSQLLDMFIAALPIPNKRRVHFHQFMDELHRRLHAMPPKPGEDYIQRLADEISHEAAVLGFDEFYLTNLPDAMLLGRLMQALFRKGTVVVATSNWPLPELFQGGLNADRFMPLLRTLESKMEPLDLGDSVDYRQHIKPTVSQYVLDTDGESAAAQLTVLFEEYAEGPAAPALSFLTAKRRQGGAIWLTFQEACEKNLGRSEYQQLSAIYNTVVIEGIPQLTVSDADAALRLATLVDILYEQRRRLIISSHVPAAQICQKGPAAQVFQRTASRLAEMTGA